LALLVHEVDEALEALGESQRLGKGRNRTDHLLGAGHVDETDTKGCSQQARLQAFQVQGRSKKHCVLSGVDVRLVPPVLGYCSPRSSGLRSSPAFARGCMKAVIFVRR